MKIPRMFTRFADEARLDRAAFAGWDIGHPLYGDCVMANYDEEQREWVIEAAHDRYYDRSCGMEWAPGCNPEPWLRSCGMLA